MKNIKSDTLLKQRREGRIEIVRGNAKPGTIAEIENCRTKERLLVRINYEKRSK